MQRLQLAVHERISRPGGAVLLPTPVPGPLRLAIAVGTPVVQRVAARVIGRGLRPESLNAELR
jgi:hypothetical protein